jgi:hypothetical protein
MAKEPKKRIKVPEGNSQADSSRENGEIFRLEHMEKEMKVPSPEEVTSSREGIFRASGSWKNIGPEAFKTYIYERRRTANRPSVLTRNLRDFQHIPDLTLYHPS